MFLFDLLGKEVTTIIGEAATTLASGLVSEYAKYLVRKQRIEVLALTDKYVSEARVDLADDFWRWVNGKAV